MKYDNNMNTFSYVNFPDSSCTVTTRIECKNLPDGGSSFSNDASTGTVWNHNSCSPKLNLTTIFTLKLPKIWKKNKQTWSIKSDKHRQLEAIQNTITWLCNLARTSWNAVRTCTVVPDITTILQVVPGKYSWLRESRISAPELSWNWMMVEPPFPIT